MYILLSKFEEIARRVHGDKYDYSNNPPVIEVDDSYPFNMGKDEVGYQGRVHLLPSEHKPTNQKWLESMVLFMRDEQDYIIPFMDGLTLFALTPEFLNSEVNKGETLDGLDSVKDYMSLVLKMRYSIPEWFYLKYVA